jgi:hypothetical protein
MDDLSGVGPKETVRARFMRAFLLECEGAGRELSLKSVGEYDKIQIAYCRRKHDARRDF